MKSQLEAERYTRKVVFFDYSAQNLPVLWEIHTMPGGIPGLFTPGTLVRHERLRLPAEAVAKNPGEADAALCPYLPRTTPCSG